MTGWLHEAAIAVQGFIELGGWVVGVLLALSVLAGAAVLWKLWHLSHLGIGRHAALREAMTALNDGDRSAARAGLRRAGTPLAALGLRAMASAESPAELRTRLYAEGDALIGRAEGGLRLLDAISQIAPLLGLFGTVLGMIEAFRALQGAGAAVDPSVLAGGIWVALMTTAVGLAVAMPVSLILSAFEARIAAERRVADLMVETLCGPALPEMGQPSAKAAPAPHAGMAGNG